MQRGEVSKTLAKESISDLRDQKFDLLYKIHLNGIHAMHRVARDADRPHNTAYWDCVIGCRVSSMALEFFKDRVPDRIYNFLEVHFTHEACHCCMGPSIVPAEIADRISNFHQQLIREHGIVSYLACMPLMGERMALAGSLFHHFKDDPHATVVGGLDEFYHTSTPLLLLSYLNPTVEELQLALDDQERYMRQFGVKEEDRKYPRIDGTLCTVKGTEEHNI